MVRKQQGAKGGLNGIHYTVEKPGVECFRYEINSSNHANGHRTVEDVVILIEAKIIHLFRLIAQKRGLEARVLF